MGSQVQNAPLNLAADDLRVDFRSGIDAGFARAQQLYETWGCFVAEQILTRELEPIRREVTRLIELAAGQAGIPIRAEGPKRFDDGFIALGEHAPEAAAAVFAATRRLTSIHQLSVDRGLLDLSRRLMHTDMVISSPYKPVRIDYDAREGFLLPWHQDYPYAQDSMDALVYWIPLQRVDDENGCVMVAPGSHRSGVLPVDILLPADEPLGIRGVALSDPRAADRFPHLSIGMDAGDVLVFSALLLHRSQLNRTPVARWTVQIRHGNFAHPVAVEKLWPRGHYERHWFDETHPEYMAARVPAPNEDR